jgi:pimeloyl-ACP methyl ester carboxylesterase
MLRTATLAVALVGLQTSATLGAQGIDTAGVRTAYAAVTALRNDYERDHGRFATVNGIKMHYLEWGDATGVPLVWAHGSASSGYEIRAVAPRLVQAGYHVLAVDYRGHGLTRVTSYEFTIHDIADDLVALLDQLKIPAAIFGGASKGGFVAAAVYDHYPNRVRGLLMADGGTWSNQWVYDRQSPEERRRSLADPVPVLTGASEFEVFRQVAGNIPKGNLQVDGLLDVLTRIGPTDDGRWTFLPGFDRMMGGYQAMAAGITRPTTLPPLQWSQQAMIPRAVFRRLHVPMMILDPQEERDHLPVTDQNERLTKDHLNLIVHRIYPESSHNILRSRPDWFVRDAVELLDRVRQVK